MNNTSALIAGLKRRIILSLALEHVLLFAAPSSCALIALSVLDYFFAVPAPVKQLAFAGALLWGAYCAYSFAAGLFGGKLDDENILMGLGRLYPEFNDEFISAWQLSKKTDPGISAELVALLVSRAENRVSRVDASRAVDLATPGSKRYLYVLSGAAALAVLLYFVPPRMLKTTLAELSGRLNYSEWAYRFDVKPGTAKLPWGSRAEIEVTAKSEIRGRPVLLTRGDEGDWLEEQLLPAGPGKYAYYVEKLAARIDYRIKWAEFKTGEFSLVPVIPPQLGDFTVKYTYPSYTAMGSQTVRGNPDVSAINGTKVVVAARSSKLIKKAEIQASWNSDSVVKAAGYDVTAGFTVTKDGSYKIAVAAQDGSFDAAPEEYRVKVIADQPPSVQLLSPSEDLIVAENTEIPLVIHAEDDFGITRVELVYRNGTGKTGRIDITGGGQAANRREFDYVWKLSKLDPKPGDRITYYVEAWDNDLRGGPKSSSSSPLSVEINDYTKEHEKIESGLKDVRDRILGVLADQNVAKKKLNELKLNFSTSSYISLLAAQSKIKEDTKTPLEELAEALKNMENDPYCDFATYGEYKGLHSHLEALEEKQMSQAVESLKEKDLKGTGRNQDEIIASLEKMALLSEDIWQYQRMRDIESAGEDLKKAAADLKEQLASNPGADRMSEQLKKLEEMLGKINNQLSKLPQELPEDFVNSPAIKEINMASYQDTLDKMREAVAKGDFQKAGELADEFQKSLESLLKGFESAAAGSGFSKAKDSELMAEVKNYSAELGSIIEQQKSWLQKTRQIDDARRRVVFSRQEKILQGLYEKQKGLNNLAVKVRSEAAGGSRLYGVYSIDQSIGLMNIVLEEFKNKRAYNSQKYLADIIKNWGEAGASVGFPASDLPEGKRAAVLEGVGAVKAGEEEILAVLKKGEEAAPAGAEGQAKFDSLSKEETALGARAYGLHGRMQEFIRKSTAVGPEAFGNLSDAGAEMNGASGKISGGDSGGAVESGEKALELLAQGQNGMQDAQGELSEMSGNSGQKIAGAVRSRSAGSSGFRNAVVKLPGKDDYKPPKEFRQDIMEALKEKYPQKYEKIIKEYYRRLTE